MKSARELARAVIMTHLDTVQDSCLNDAAIASESVMREALKEAFRAGAEAMQEKCVKIIPGGDICDPQKVCDAIRALPRPEMPTATEGE